MEIQGRVQNGVVILEGKPQLPEGLVLTVSLPDPPPAEPPAPRQRVSFPLIRTGRPGSLRLTAERVAEILEDEDLSTGLEPLASAGRANSRPSHGRQELV